MSSPPNEHTAGPVPILLMVRALDLGGTERQLTQAAKSLDRSRFVPHVGCFRADGVRGDELRAANVPVVSFPVRSFYAPSTLVAGHQLVRYVRRHGIQLVHTFDVPATLFGVPAGRLSRAPVVISSQRANRRLTTSVTRRLLRITDRMVDAVVVNCDAMRRHLIDEERVPSTLVHVCRNGLDTALFRPDESGSLQGHAGASLIVGTLSVLRPEKAITLLLDAFAEVRAIRPDIKLVIIGSGPSLPELRAKCDALGLRDACRFDTAPAGVSGRLRAIDVFVLPSRSEALSNALMEAMACGCAVIASRVGGNPELVQHQRTGLLFDDGDVAGLAASIRSLVDSPSLRSKLGAEAAAFVRENLSATAAAERLAGLYAGLLETRGSIRRALLVA
jgi:glycosyltransferase involved in cell wall biosynthesis